MSTWTPMPTTRQTLFQLGLTVPGGLVWTYVAGLSTPLATASDATGTLNTNPIVADASGRFVAFLAVGNTYKFVYEAAATPPAHGAVLYTDDLIPSVPASAGNTEVPAVAGETLAAGKAVYLSDGSGGKNVGQWYLADQANAYSSTSPEVGMTLSAITAGQSGTVRQAGQVTGLTSLTTGAAYYIGTAGAITATRPSGNDRFLGVADSTTTLILSANPPGTNGLDVFQIEVFV